MSEQEIDTSKANDDCVGPQSDAAGKASSCAGCPNQNACASGAAKQVDPAIAEVNTRFEGMRHKLLILSGKGGVGKSTFASQFAWALSDDSYQVGVLDIDICGPSVPRMLGVEREEVRRSASGWTPVYASDTLCCMSIGFMLQSREDAVIWRGPRKNGLIRQFLTDVDWPPLDFLIVDAPPGTSDEHISIAQYTVDAGVDGCIIVTTPQEVALLDVRKEISFCRKTKLNIIGVVENMSSFQCPNCSHQSSIFTPTTGGAQKMCAEMGVRFLGSIPLDPNMLKCCEEGRSYFAEADAAAEPKLNGSAASKPNVDHSARASFRKVINSIFETSDSMMQTRAENANNKTEDEQIQAHT